MYVLVSWRKTCFPRFRFFDFAGCRKKTTSWAAVFVPLPHGPLQVYYQVVPAGTIYISHHSSITACLSVYKMSAQISFHHKFNPRTKQILKKLTFSPQEQQALNAVNRGNTFAPPFLLRNVNQQDTSTTEKFTDGLTFWWKGFTYS